MQLNDIFEENTLESISQRTRIPAEMLEQLLRCNIGAFQKVQALGFISILEREYRTDLGDFRKECLAAFSSQPERSESLVPRAISTESSSHKPLIVEVTDGEQELRLYKVIGVLVLVGLLLYGAWVSFSSMQQTGEDNQSSGHKVGFFVSVADQIRQQLNGDSGTETATDNTLESNVETGANASSAPTLSASAGGTMIQRSAETETLEQIRQIDDQIAQVKVQDEASPDSNNGTSLEAEVPSMSMMEHTTISHQSVRLDAAEQEAARQAEAQRQIAMEAERKAAEAAARQQAKAARQAAAEKARLEEEARKKAVEEARRIEEEAARKKAEAAAARKAEEAARKQAEEAARKAAERKAAEAARKKAAEAAGGVVLAPHAKVWLGIVDLISMKRRVVTTKAPIAFKNPDGRWLVATGHGRFALKMGSRTLDFGDSKKHFLLIENGTVREISHERFQQLNKSKVW